jgi:hypothetical protein
MLPKYTLEHYLYVFVNKNNSDKGPLYLYFAIILRISLAFIYLLQKRFKVIPQFSKDLLQCTPSWLDVRDQVRIVKLYDKHFIHILNKENQGSRF